MVREVSDGTVAKVLKKGGASKTQKWGAGFARVEYDPQTALGEEDPTEQWVTLRPNKFNGDGKNCWRLDPDGPTT